MLFEPCLRQPRFGWALGPQNHKVEPRHGVIPRMHSYSEHGRTPRYLVILANFCRPDFLSHNILCKVEPRRRPCRQLDKRFSGIRPQCGWPCVRSTSKPTAAATEGSDRETHVTVETVETVDFSLLSWSNSSARALHAGSARLHADNARVASVYYTVYSLKAGARGPGGAGRRPTR